MNDPIVELLPELILVEEAAQRHCAAVARHLEFAPRSFALLEIADHADASLEDLFSLAETRGVACEQSIAQRAAVAFATARRWLVAMLFDEGGLYARAFAELRRGFDLGCKLRDAACARGDRVLGDWCALWLEQRKKMLRRIERELAPARGA